MFYDWHESIADVDEDARAEAAAERRQRARMRHWCTECHGNTGPGSPCFIELEPAEDEDA